MRREKWSEILLPQGDDSVWELFHENSKTSRYDIYPSDAEVQQQMNESWEALPFEGYPVVELPRSLAPVNLTLEEALLTRVSARDFEPCPLSLENVATILYYAYGVTRDNINNDLPRPFRTVPSGGALYPLEIFFFSKRIREVEPGLYHYNPSMNHLRLLDSGDKAADIAGAFVQGELALNSSLIIFITAMFERSTFKYGARGYRFALLEAGHVAQNINVVANGLGLGSVNIGGYFDREIDNLLGLDGLTHSTIYLIALGKEQAARS